MSFHVSNAPCLQTEKYYFTHDFAFTLRELTIMLSISPNKVDTASRPRVASKNSRRLRMCHLPPCLHQFVTRYEIKNTYAKKHYGQKYTSMRELKNDPHRALYQTSSTSVGTSGLLRGGTQELSSKECSHIAYTIFTYVTFPVMVSMNL